MFLEPQNLEALLVDLLLSLVVLAVTYILIKTLNRILSRLLQEGSREQTEGDEAAAEKAAVRQFNWLGTDSAKTLLYGGYF